VSWQELIANKGGSCSEAVSLVAVYLLNVRHTINHMGKYYVFPSHFCLNRCSAGDNYSHA